MSRYLAIVQYPDNFVESFYVWAYTSNAARYHARAVARSVQGRLINVIEE